MLLLAGISGFAQVSEWPSPEVESMFNQGMTSLNRGNTNEAIAIFQRTLQLAPTSIVTRRSLAMAYQLAGDNKQALKTLDPLFDNKTADETSYRVAAIAYQADQETVKARKVLQNGIDKFKSSGMLYHELGLVYESEENYEDALKTWLEGLKKDRNYHLNYYEAAMAYMRTDNAIWPILFGEIFILKEPTTRRAEETRIMLLDAYKKLFFSPLKKGEESKNIVSNAPANFEQAVEQTFQKLFYLVSDGITTENLTMLRTRFIIDWSAQYQERYPYSLFRYQEQLITNGHFDAYNQWLWGKVENAQQFAAWTQSFQAEMSSLDSYLKDNPLQLIPSDDYNNQRSFRNLFQKQDKKTGKR